MGNEIFYQLATEIGKVLVIAFVLGTAVGTLATLGVQWLL